jgi:hypothetical protein
MNRQTLRYGGCGRRRRRQAQGGRERGHRQRAQAVRCHVIVATSSVPRHRVTRHGCHVIGCHVISATPARPRGKLSPEVALNVLLHICRTPFLESYATGLMVWTRLVAGAGRTRRYNPTKPYTIKPETKIP